jgi:hypothetical protein
MKPEIKNPVIPAKAGIQGMPRRPRLRIPALAGMATSNPEGS